MATLILLQVALPLAVILWLMVWPLANRLGLTMQMLAATLILLTAARVGVWTIIPVWTPYALAALLLVAVVKSFRQRPHASRPSSLASWAATVAAMTMILAASGLLFRAFSAQNRPPNSAIVLARPVTGNDLRVANGGSNTSVNAHADTLDLSVLRHRDWTGQSYGIDIVAMHANGMTSDGFQPSDPVRYAVFGRPVLAPCNGVVVATRNDRPDLPVPHVDRRVMTGNLVTLRCKGIEVVMAHLQRSSVAVTTGDRVTVGTLLGRVGNSGLSDEPHLHMHAQTPGTARAPHSGRPVPMLFAGRFPVRNDKF